MPKNKYSLKAANRTGSVSAKGSHLRVHFKNTRETAMAIKGMTLRRAQRYLVDVTEHTDCIPFRRFTGGVGRCSQAKNHPRSNGQGRFPVKSVEFIQNLLKNAESNAEARNLNVDDLVIVHAQVNQAAKARRRIYRAHGRINPFMRRPCHIEFILSEKASKVKKPAAASEGTEEAKALTN